MASVVSWASDINPDPGCSRTTDPDMDLSMSINTHVAFGDNLGRGHQHGSQMVQDYGYLHEPMASTWPGTVDRSYKSNTGSMDQRSVSRRPIQTMNHSSS